MYSYLPNKQGDPNKRGGWKIYAIGEGGKIFYYIDFNVEGGKFFQN